MAQAKLTIDLDALRANWRALNALSQGETAAVVKADGYGLGATRVARALAREGVQRFFVALSEEGAALREALGPGPEILVFSGHMAGDTDMINDLGLIPMINNIDQMLRHVEALPGAPFGIQLDTGMNRLGMEPAEWAALRDIALAQNPVLIMSHLACSDVPGSEVNALQLQAFCEMTDGIDVPRSLAATGGILMGPDYHFDVSRAGIGLYGGMPFVDATPVVTLEIPVIQVRDVAPGEVVGYGATFTASRPTKIATVSAGYADGLHRIMGPKASLMAGETRCPVAGRISMDLIGVDVTDAKEVPDMLEMIGLHQSIDTVADWSGTIGYEVLTSMGARLSRVYRGE